MKLKMFGQISSENVLKNMAEVSTPRNIFESIMEEKNSFARVNQSFGMADIQAAIAASRAQETGPQVVGRLAKQEAEAVTQVGGMAKRTLSGVLEAGEVAAKVMRFRV